VKETKIDVIFKKMQGLMLIVFLKKLTDQLNSVRVYIL